ncbi:hypothetical protein OSB04_017882 [Centaurea solstitialis]|uniref:Auxin response factor domain-containing protein n=1 Tax=Centaurea solstitialis TaxID=347529 RepID=A0AA38W9W8_9ASTR|nr:hypothetical protein OSB04_017882 [Centaurea solstitialis]
MINVMNDVKEKGLDSQLWHACAGGMVQMPPVNTRVLYFPQGHAEHSGVRNVDFGNFRRIPPYILCRVSAVKFMADTDTDEVYARIRLQPLANQIDYDFEEVVKINENKEKPSSFAKTLTQSDANNGGGFSVPKVLRRDDFPAAGLRGGAAGSVHLGVRTSWTSVEVPAYLPRDSAAASSHHRMEQAKRGIGGGFLKTPLLRLLRRWVCGIPTGERKRQRRANPSAESVIRSGRILRPTGARLRSFTTLEQHAGVLCQGFDRKSCDGDPMVPGMRFKMAFETEDSSRISWFMGTISSVQVEDQNSWPNSPWRLLQVAWDEPELLQNVKRVNPWLVELVASMPAMHLSPFSPPRKKLRIPQPPDFPLLMMSTSIQGARHSSHFGLDHNHHLRPKTGSKTKDDEKEKRKPLFMLFGQPILTEEQLSESFSGDTTANASDGSVVLQNGSVRSSSDDDGSWVETGHCKVFMESEDVGRSLDLTALQSYEELYKELGGMFGFEKSDFGILLLFCSEFSKVARRLTIVRGIRGGSE